MKRVAPQSTLPYKKVKSYQRKVPSLTQEQVKAVRAIATKAARSVGETKSPLTSYDKLGADGIVYAQNLNYQIAQGVTAESVIGEKLFIKNFNIHGYAVNLSGSNNNSPLTLRMLVVRNESVLATTSPSSILATDVFRSSSGKLARQGHVDLHKVTLLYEKQITITPVLNATNAVQTFNIRVPINKSHWFRSDNSGYLKGGDYYLIFLGEKDTAPVGDAYYMSYQWAVNYTDE